MANSVTGRNPFIIDTTAAGPLYDQDFFCSYIQCTTRGAAGGTALITDRKGNVIVDVIFSAADETFAIKVDGVLHGLGAATIATAVDIYFYQKLG